MFHRRQLCSTAPRRSLNFVPQPTKKPQFFVRSTPVMSFSFYGHFRGGIFATTHMIFPPNTPQKTHVSLLLSCRPAHSGYTRQPHLVLRRRAQVPSMHATMRSLANRNKSTSRDCESEKQRRTRQTNGPGEKNNPPPRQTAPSGQTRHFAQYNRSAISGLPWGPRSPRVGPYYRHIPIQVNTRVAQVAPGRKIFPTLLLCLE